MRRAAVQATVQGSVAACALPATQSSAADDDEVDVTLQQVSSHVYYAQRAPQVATDNQGFVSNAGVIVTEAGVVVFDALGTPALSEKTESIDRNFRVQLSKVGVGFDQLSMATVFAVLNNARPQSVMSGIGEGRSSNEYVSYATDADRSGDLTVFVPQFGLTALTASTTFHDRKMATPVLASESSAFLEAVQTVGRS